MVGAVLSLTVTVVLELLVHPNASVNVTEYVPDVTTLIGLLVEPLLHK